jgi:hypothetical protein
VGGGVHLPEWKKYLCRVGKLFQAEERKILPAKKGHAVISNGFFQNQETPFLTVLLYINELLINSNSWQTTFPVFCTSKKKD